MPDTSTIDVRAVPRADSARDGDLAARQHEVLRTYDLLDLPVDAELDAVVRVAASVAGVPTATVNVLDTQRQCSLGSFGFPGGVTPRDDSICVTTSQLGRPFATADLTTDARFAGNPFVDGRFGRLRQYASVPLVVDGVAIGTLCVFDEVVRELTAAQVDALVDLAAVVVALLERRRQAREVAELAAVSQAAHAALTATTEELARARAFDHALLESLPIGVVAATADGEVTLVNRACREWLGDRPDSEGGLDRPISRYHLTATDGTTPIEQADLPLFRALRGEELADGIEVIIAPEDRPRRSLRARAVPVRGPGGELLGAVSTLADVTTQRCLEEQLRLAALHDPLTGLPNRSLLVDRLDHELATLPRRGGHLAVLYCDLDGFKEVNDRFGHATGDEVLRQAAQRMVHAVRPGDTVGRIGGDEFVVLCPGVTSLDAAAAIAARIEASLREPMPGCGGSRHQVGISIGAVLDGVGSTPETMLTAADEAMYAVKAAHHARRRQPR